MKARKLTITALVALLSAGAGGCTGTIYKQSTLGDLETLSVDARQRLSFVGLYTDEDGYTRRALCTEPSPDAAVARAASFAAALSNPILAPGATTAAGNAAAGVAGSSSEAIASLSARTQTIQLLRDGYFRACEGLLNGVIDKWDYKAILSNIDATMVALAAVDALGGSSTQAPGVAVTTGPASATAPVNGANVSASAGEGTTTSVVVQETFPQRGKVEEAQANAIRAIALEAMKAARAREARLAQLRSGSVVRRR
jgi:hypothetical protein